MAKPMSNSTGPFGFASLKMTIGYSDFVIISSFVIRHSSFSS